MFSFSQLATRAICSAALLLSASVFANAATVTVTPTVTSIAGGYQYAYSISYTGTDDAFLIDISVPKTPTAVSSLTAPAGFTTAFDSVLGLASFLEGTGSFTSTPTTGFVFDSPYAPGTASFTASVLGTSGITSITGSTLAPTVVPEPSTLFLLTLLAPVVFLIKRRHATTHPMETLHVSNS